jgi:hypothetical protein
MEAADLRNINLDLNFGECDKATAGLSVKLTVHIGKAKADEVLNGIKEKFGEDASMKPVIYFDTDSEEAAEKLIQLANVG